MTDQTEAQSKATAPGGPYTNPWMVAINFIGIAALALAILLSVLSLGESSLLAAASLGIWSNLLTYLSAMFFVAAFILAGVRWMLRSMQEGHRI